MRRFLPALALAAAAQAAPPGATTLPRLLSAGLGAVPWSTQSGGIAAYDVSLDENGSVTGADIVQDVAPYGELLGAASVRTCLDDLGADRLGHGVRVVEDRALLDRVVAAGVPLEVCPVSNVALGVFSDLTSVPLPTLLDAGATVALGADDPLLFGSRLAGQYATMRAAHDLPDECLAELARMSVRASRAPEDVRARTLREIDEWLASPPP